MSSPVCPGVRSSRTDGAELRSVRVPVEPSVALVDRPVIVNARVAEERGVDRVIGVVMAEHHVGDVLRRRAVRLERGQERVAVGDHPWIDDDDGVAIANQRDGAAHALAVAVETDVSVVKHVHFGGTGGRNLQ